MASAEDRRPFVFALFKPLAGDHLKCVGAFQGRQPLGLFFCLSRIVSGGEHLACLRTPLAGVSQVTSGYTPNANSFSLPAKKYFSRQYLLPDGMTKRNSPSPSAIL